MDVINQFWQQQLASIYNFHVVILFFLTQILVFFLFTYSADKADKSKGEGKEFVNASRGSSTASVGDDDSHRRTTWYQFTVNIQIFLKSLALVFLLMEAYSLMSAGIWKDEWIGWEHRGVLFAKFFILLFFLYRLFALSSLSVGEMETNP